MAEQGQPAIIEVLEPAGRLVTYQLAGTGLRGSCLPARATRCTIDLSLPGRGLYIVSIHANELEVRAPVSSCEQCEEPKVLPRAKGFFSTQMGITAC